MAEGNVFINFASALNLNVHTGGDASPAEDVITFFLKGQYDSNSNVLIQFRKFGFNDRVAQFRPEIRNQTQPVSTLGLASILEVNNSADDLLMRDRFASLSEQDRLNAQVADKTWIIPSNDWQFLAIPKRQFVLFGGFSFADVDQFGILYFNTPGGEYCISDVLLVGGGRDNSGGAVTPPGANGSASNGGLQGTYKYKISFLNSTTGNRSNGSAATQVAENVNRGYVALSGIPTSADAQVSHVEIWRTLGNGDRFFKIGQVANGTATFDDEVADHDTLDSTTGTAVMTTLELPTDNDPPEDSFDGCIVDKLTAFWISNDTGKQGRVFFSPIGRPESLKGFIDVTRAGDPLHRLVVHAGTRYAFSESKLYRINGEDPYVAQEIAGVPGVQFAQRRTVVSTPFGIVWQATDGIRIFNNLRATLLNPDPIGRIFRGETAEGLPAFEGTTATFARDEYIVSNGSRTLGISLTDFSWRDIGINDASALFYEWDTDKLVAGRAGNTQLIEEEGVSTDAGSSIPFEWETPAVDASNDAVLFLRRVFIDMDANGNTVTPTVTHRFTSFNLTAISDASRIAREFTVERLLLKPALRLAGNATNRVELFQIEFDIDPLVLGVTVSGRSARNAVASNRIEFAGRYREGTGNGEIVFEVPRRTADYDMTDRIFVIDRLTVEANTSSTNLTPTLGLVGGDVSFAAINNSVREITTYEIDRIGNIDDVVLQGDFFTGTAVPTVYRVELHMRELELGVNIFGTDTRDSFPARSPDPGTEIVFEIPPNRREFDDAGTLFILDRLVFDIDSNGSTITPIIDVQGGGSITLSGVSSTVRQLVEVSIDRVGTIHSLRLQDDFTGDVQIFGVELYMRPLVLGVNITTANTRGQVRGRTVDPTTSITFEVQPILQELNAQGTLMWIERLVVEADTNSSTITPSIVSNGANYIPSTTITTTARSYTEIAVQRPGPVFEVQLADNFTDDVQLFGVELYMRPVELGVQQFNGSRVTYDGKMVTPGTELVFDVDPARHEVDGTVNIPIVQFLHLDINSAGVAVTPVIQTEFGNISLTAATTSSRQTVIYDIQQIGNIQAVKLQADFAANAIELYGVEIIIGNLTLDMYILDGGDN